MSDRFSGIGNIPPAYPIKPVEPSGKDRPSGERKRKPPKRQEKPSDESSNDSSSNEKPQGETTHKIDEYI